MGKRERKQTQGLGKPRRGRRGCGGGGLVRMEYWQHHRMESDRRVRRLPDPPVPTEWISVTSISHQLKESSQTTTMKDPKCILKEKIILTEVGKPRLCYGMIRLGLLSLKP